MLNTTVPANNNSANNNGSRTFGTEVDANVIPRPLPLPVMNNQIPENKMPVIISVEAAIGTGKSSLLKMIQAREPTWIVVQEPVDMWQKVGGKHNLLEAFYGNLERYAFSFQTFCVLSRIESVVKALRDCPDSTPVVVLERSWMSDRHTFAEMLHQQGRISEMEWALYDHWYQFCVRSSPQVEGHLYLDVSVETCMARLRKRNRMEESSVTPEYQAALIDQHEKWLKTCDQGRVCRVNVDDCFLSKQQNSDAIMNTISKFVGCLKEARPASK